MEAAAAGEGGPVWFVAVRQTAGRGRHGRPWVSAAGNLYASHLKVTRLPAERLSLLPLAAAVALAEALEAAAALAGRVRLKWPNDVLVDGAKVSGILLEARHGLAMGSAVVTGFGVNCAHHPTDAPYPVTSLAAAGTAAGPEAVLAALAPRYGAAWERLGGSDDPSQAVRAAWLARAVGIGGPVAVRLPGGTLEGLFRGLDAAGRLELLAPDGRLHLVAAGDVFFGTHPAVGGGLRPGPPRPIR